MTLKAVLFDRDDTLSLNRPLAYLEAANWANAEYGLEVEKSLAAMQAQWQSVSQKWQSLRTLQDELEFWRVYGEELSVRLERESEVGRRLVEHFPYWAFIQAAPEAREILGQLKAMNLKIGVLSNTLPNIQPTLEAVGLADLIDLPMASCTLGYLKPEPEVFRLAATALELEFGEILFVDDLIENVEAARALGMPALHIHHSGENGDVSSLREVLEYVEGQACTSTHT